MQTSFVAIFGLLAAAVSAIPTENTGTPYKACPSGLYSVPQCCATDVLGVADLNCNSPSKSFNSAQSFKNVCAAGGQRARCCVLPVLGQSVLCETPAGLGEQ
ncbi:fungal hydrophobin-domain-containing protein [Xylaria flabelliformis]|nr:fungal hydrophobin-domain-containing protein [Xylaria flabelliformis]